MRTAGRDKRSGLEQKKTRVRGYGGLLGIYGGPRTPIPTVALYLNMPSWPPEVGSWPEQNILAGANIPWGVTWLWSFIWNLWGIRGPHPYGTLVAGSPSRGPTSGRSEGGCRGIQKGSGRGTEGGGHGGRPLCWHRNNGHWVI